MRIVTTAPTSRRSAPAWTAASHTDDIVAKTAVPTAVPRPPFAGQWKRKLRPTCRSTPSAVASQVEATTSEGTFRVGAVGAAGTAANGAATIPGAAIVGGAAAIADTSVDGTSSRGLLSLFSEHVLHPRGRRHGRNARPLPLLAEAAVMERVGAGRHATLDPHPEARNPLVAGAGLEGVLFGHPHRLTDDECGPPNAVVPGEMLPETRGSHS
jgi:hypothetical protein